MMGSTRSRCPMPTHARKHLLHCPDARRHRVRWEPPVGRRGRTAARITHVLLGARSAGVCSLQTVDVGSIWDVLVGPPAPTHQRLSVLSSTPNTSLSSTPGPRFGGTTVIHHLDSRVIMFGSHIGHFFLYCSTSLSGQDELHL